MYVKRMKKTRYDWDQSLRLYFKYFNIVFNAKLVTWRRSTKIKTSIFITLGNILKSRQNIDIRVLTFVFVSIQLTINKKVNNYTNRLFTCIRFT